MYGEVHSRFEQPAESIHATLPARIALSVLYCFVSSSLSPRRHVNTCDVHPSVRCRVHLSFCFTRDFIPYFAVYFSATLAIPTPS